MATQQTYKISLDSHIGMFVHFYASKTVEAASLEEAQAIAREWASIQPERECVAVESVKLVD